jgi:hypothetical protein
MANNGEQLMSEIKEESTSNEIAITSFGPSYYAQLNDDLIVVGISQLSSKVDKPNMILLSDYDAELMGNLYNPETIEFIPQETIVDYGSKITKRALSQRLNPVIREAIRKSTDEIVVDIREDLKLAEYADLKDNDLITSLKYLVYVGVMTQAEMDLVIGLSVTEIETY